MYQVIARTWRPQRFSEVIGQRHVTQTLQNAIRLDRIGHGYIFSGQRGVGKTTVARLLAKALNCQRGPSPEPCGECDSCREISAGRSVDVIEIDAASNRGIDAVRELRENARYAPARDRYKVFIIDEAHQITPEGFNALLKTLEEPPAHVIFLLATTEVHQFPETILSRCQHFSLHTLTFSEILGHLEKVCAAENVEADPEALAVLAKSGEGSLRDALSRLEQAIAAFGSRLEGSAVRRFLGEPPSSLIEEVFSAVRERRRKPMLEVVEKLVEDGYQLTHFCSQLVRTVRNLLIIRVAGEEPRLLESLLDSSAEEIQRLVALAEGFTEESLMRYLEILLQLHQELRYSMEPRFQMELGLLKLVDAEKLVAIEDLLAQMESREQGTGKRERGTVPLSDLAGGNREQAARPSSPSLGSEQSPRPGKPSPFEQDSLRKKQPHDPSAHAAISPEGRVGAEDASSIPPIRAATHGTPGQIEKERSAARRTEGAISFIPGAENSVMEATSGVAAAAATAVASLPSIETGLSSQEEGWKQEILRRLEEQSRHVLASLLSDAKGWKFGEAEVRIRLAQEGMEKAIQDSDRQCLDQICTAILGRKVKVNLGEDGRNRPQEARGKAGRVKPALPTQGGGGQDADGGGKSASLEIRVRQDPEILEFEKLFGKRVAVIRDWKE